ncbi:MAG: hypothetical protein AAF126_03070 [Chloroflexota bacterium]
MTLSAFMTTTATTKRRSDPAAVTGIIGDHVAYLSGVKVTPVMLPSAKGEHNAMGVSGFDGTSVYSFETFTESHAHTKDGISVTELPDIRANDLITIDGIEYTVKQARRETLTSAFGATLYIYLSEDNA